MDAFYGEIRAFPYNFAPENWAYANGAKVAISQNPPLNAVISNTFGGDLKTYFNLPDLVSNVVLGAGQGPGLTSRPYAHLGGAAQAVASAIPPHNHTLFAETSNSTTVPSTGATGTPSATTVPSRALVAPVPPGKSVFAYNSATPDVVMDHTSIGVTGNATPASHSNTQPTLAIPYCICILGEFPFRP